MKYLPIILWAVADMFLVASLFIAIFCRIWQGSPSVWERWRAKRKADREQ